MQDSAIRSWNLFLLNVGLMFVNPAGLGSALGSAASAINTAATVGNTINGIQAFAEGHVWDGLLAFAGAGLSALRGVTPCAWQGLVEKWGQKALHGVFVVTNVQSAMERFEEGDIFGALVDLADAGANAYRFGQSCHIEGTLLRTPAGLKRVEDIEPYEDDLLSRSELAPDGPIVAKRVLQKFIRTAQVWHLIVNGKLLGTTAEHPYFGEDLGWTPTAMLEAGQRIRGEEDGSWVTVEAVRETHDIKTVYNFEIEDYHTYFVSGENLGFSVWAHNYPTNDDEGHEKGTGPDPN